MKIIHDFVEPESLSPEDFDAYLAKGWFRMYQRMFSVTHWLNGDTFDIDRVWWLRFELSQIQQHKSHQRICKKNARFDVQYEKYDGISEEDKALYRLYREWIRFDAYDDLAQSLYGNEDNKNIFNSWSIAIRDEGKLIARGIIDLGATALMAKINFFDPAYASYSPGKYLMLKSLDFMRTKGLKWYYPGYIIVDRPKFDYKLFLGEESAEYYDPETEAWKPYHPDIMKTEIRTEEEQDLLEDVYFRIFR